jgi:hypothetical protein
MSELNTAESIAESLRQESYHLFRNDCLIKSLRFRSQCQKIGIGARLVWCALGLAKAKLPLLGEISIPYCTHFWGEVNGQRFETSRHLGSQGGFGIVPSQIKPIIVVRFR